MLISANMADENNNDNHRHRMKAQEKTSRAHQKALENIQ